MPKQPDKVIPCSRETHKKLKEIIKDRRITFDALLNELYNYRYDPR